MPSDPRSQIDLPISEDQEPTLPAASSEISAPRENTELQSPAEMARAQESSSSTAEPTERLHPVSIAINVIATLRSFAGPIVFLALVRGSLASLTQLGALIPIAGAAIFFGALRYFAYRYGVNERGLEIREGIISRQSRSIPFERIQNLDIVQGPIQRRLGVAELKVDTAGGSSAEASMRVLSMEAIEELETAFEESKARRRRARAGSAMSSTGDLTLDPARGNGAADTEDAKDLRESMGKISSDAEDGALRSGVAQEAEESGSERPAAYQKEQILHELSLLELAKLGIGSNKGLALGAAGLGLAWESTWTSDRFGFDNIGQIIKSAVGASNTDLVGRYAASPKEIVLLSVLILFAIAAIFVFLKLVSIAWVIVRFYDFRLSMRDEDLRIRHGLLTRYSQTIPKRRIQSVSVVDGPLLRVFGRTGVAIKTAGADAGGGALSGKVWLSPIIERSQVEGLLDSVSAGLGQAFANEDNWHGLHPKAEKRMRRKDLIVGIPFALLLLGGTRLMLPEVLQWPAYCLILVYILGHAFITSRIDARYTAVSYASDFARIRRGAWTKRFQLARVGKIQNLSLHTSPFDRRHGMMNLLIDTAGSGGSMHRMSVPYLAEDVALEARDVLGSEIAEVPFTW